MKGGRLQKAVKLRPALLPCTLPTCYAQFSLQKSKAWLYPVRNLQSSNRNILYASQDRALGSLLGRKLDESLRQDTFFMAANPLLVQGKLERK